MYRQGDVYLIKARKNAKRGNRVEPVNGRIVLVEGEATGHCHTVDSQVCDFFGGDKPVLVVREETALTHPEHATIEVAPGIYWVVRQREYTPKAIVKVVD